MNRVVRCLSPKDRPIEMDAGTRCTRLPDACELDRLRASLDRSGKTRLHPYDHAERWTGEIVTLKDCLAGEKVFVEAAIYPPGQTVYWPLFEIVE